MDYEKMKLATQTYFSLLKEKVIGEDHECYSFYQDGDVRQGVLLLADQSGTQIVEANTRIHLVVKGTGSVFATNFTHLREKYKDIESKKQLHVINVILMALIAQFDRNIAARVRWKRDGLTYYALERAVSELVARWGGLIAEDEEAAVESKIDMHNVVAIWSNLELDNEESKGAKRSNKKTKIGYIAGAVKLLEDEGVIVVLDKESVPKIFPKSELFERIDHLYHNYDRFQELKSLMDTEGLEHA